MKDINSDAKNKKWITGAKSDFLNELIKDCIYYNLNDDDSLRYVEIRFKQPITKSVLWTRKARIRSEDSAGIWLSYFSRSGYIMEHKKSVEIVQRLIDSSMNELYFECKKPYEFKERDPKDLDSNELKNDAKIFKLKSDVRESIKLYRELMSDTPLIAEIKGHIDSAFKLRIKLLEEYGMDVDDKGNISFVNSRFHNSGKSLTDKRDPRDDPEAVF